KVFADASTLNFIEEPDLYSLFGNALDNAIEAVSKIKEPSKRLICLYIRRVMGKKTSVTLENYYDGQIKFNEKGLPITTKKNDGYHGFGMKSMYETVKKYGGDICCTLEKDRFKLFLLF
ncbi:MAG TPA: ATP-binding protein, partial [Firmicutes bacterium]|nr:ATP-binding protein [Bacillota bacterium]